MSPCPHRGVRLIHAFAHHFSIFLEKYGECIWDLSDVRKALLLLITTDYTWKAT
jgi:hypothetical protein